MIPPGGTMLHQFAAFPGVVARLSSQRASTASRIREESVTDSLMGSLLVGQSQVISRNEEGRQMNKQKHALAMVERDFPDEIPRIREPVRREFDITSTVFELSVPFKEDNEAASRHTFAQSNAIALPGKKW